MTLHKLSSCEDIAAAVPSTFPILGGETLLLPLFLLSSRFDVEAPVLFVEVLFCQKGQGKATVKTTDHSSRREVDFFRPDEEEVKTWSKILKVGLGAKNSLSLMRIG
jgi:hypothetical protein